MRLFWVWGPATVLVSLLLHWYAETGMPGAYHSGNAALVGRLDLCETLSTWMLAVLIGAMPIALLTMALVRNRGRRQRRN